MEKFSLQEHASKLIAQVAKALKTPVENISTTFTGDTPWQVISVDGFDLVYHIPSAFSGTTTLVCVFVSYSMNHRS